MVDAVPASNSGSNGQIVVAGAGYAGLHVALRLTAKLRNHPEMELTLVGRHDYHQVLTELPRVAGPCCSTSFAWPGRSCTTRSSTTSPRCTAGPARADALRTGRPVYRAGKQHRRDPGPQKGLGTRCRVTTRACQERPPVLQAAREHQICRRSGPAFSPRRLAPYRRHCARSPRAAYRSWCCRRPAYLRRFSGRAAVTSVLEVTSGRWPRCLLILIRPPSGRITPGLTRHKWYSGCCSRPGVGSDRGDVSIGAGFRTGREHLAGSGHRLLRGPGAG